MPDLRPFTPWRIVRNTLDEPQPQPHPQKLQPRASDKQVRGIGRARHLCAAVRMALAPPHGGERHLLGSVQPTDLGPVIQQA